MRRKVVEGICHVCGEKGKMSFEHIPPKSMGNTGRIKKYSGVDIIEKKRSFDFSDNSGIPYEQQQRGSGFTTICASCNSYFGQNYVNCFSGCIEELARMLALDSLVAGQVGIHLEGRNVNTLGFFKHVISNFCATTHEGSMLDCRDYLLNRESVEFPSRFRLFMSAVPEMTDKLISTGWCGMIVDISKSKAVYVASLAYYPVCFYLLDESLSTANPPFPLGCDITPMAEYTWDEKPKYKLELPFMTLKSGFPKPVWLDK